MACQVHKAGSKPHAAGHQPLLLFGQTALFFYIVHRIIFDSSARLFDLQASMGLADIYLVSLAMLVFLYPLCLWYRRYKAAHRDSWVRFI